MEILKILTRESEFTQQMMYLYEEDGKWYAYGSSAVRIRELLKGFVVMEQVRYDAFIMLKVAEVDLAILMTNLDNIGCSIVSCSDMELVLRSKNCQVA